MWLNASEAVGLWIGVVTVWVAKQTSFQDTFVYSQAVLNSRRGSKSCVFFATGATGATGVTCSSGATLTRPTRP